jgi:hypothetical protein
MIFEADVGVVDLEGEEGHATAGDKGVFDDDEAGAKFDVGRVTVEGRGGEGEEGYPASRHGAFP